MSQLTDAALADDGERTHIRPREETRFYVLRMLQIGEVTRLFTVELYSLANERCVVFRVTREARARGDVLNIS